MRWALAMGSLLLLAVSSLVIYQQLTPAWRDYQRAYFRQARARATSKAEQAELAQRRPKIEQTMVTGFGETRVDRCQTCHIAVDDPRFVAAAQPLRTHPYSEALGDVYRNGRWERRHNFSDFGCTVCHDGQGRGIEVHDAHGEDPSWPWPLLGFASQTTWREDVRSLVVGRQYLQANCVQCHGAPDFPGTPSVAKGRELFFRTGCYGCHRIEGVSSGTLAPELTEVGKYRKLDYLWEHLVDPRSLTPTSFMPQFILTWEETSALVVYLKSQRGVNYGQSELERYRLAARPPTPKIFEAAARTEEPFPACTVSPLERTLVWHSFGAPPSAPADQEVQSPAARGEQLIEKRGCLACHKLGDCDGGIAPDLSFEGLLHDRAWLLEHFKNPRARVPGSVMPAFSFPEEDFQAITDYLQGQTTKPKPANFCARCHGEKGDGKGINAIYLDPAPPAFTNVKFWVTQPKERFLQSIKEGVPGTAMPAWGKVLTDEQIESAFDYEWQAFVREPRKVPIRRVPEHNPIAVSAASVARGEHTFLQNCATCHGRKADGKGPKSQDLTPRPRNLRNAAFIRNVADHRLFESILYGVDGTAMPPWTQHGLTEQNAGDLVNFIRELNGR